MRVWVVQWEGRVDPEIYADGSSYKIFGMLLDKGIEPAKIHTNTSTCIQVDDVMTALLMDVVPLHKD